MDISFGGRTAWSPGLVMIPATYHTITEKECQCLARIPQADTVTANAKTDEVPRHIKQHEAKLEKRYQMVNSEDIMKKQLLESLDKKQFKGKNQAYNNYANHTLAGLIQKQYNDHGTI